MVTEPRNVVTREHVDISKHVFLRFINTKNIEKKRTENENTSTCMQFE